MQVRLAFVGPDGRTLQEESRELTLRPSASAAARAILDALRGGSRQGRGAVLSPAVQVRHVFVDKRGVAYVDLSREFLQPTVTVDSRGAPAGPAAAQAPPGAAARTVSPAATEAGGGQPGEGAPGNPIVLAARAMAATLGMSLPEVAEVQFLAEGREISVVADGVDLRHPIPASLPTAAPPTQP